MVKSWKLAGLLAGPFLTNASPAPMIEERSAHRGLKLKNFTPPPSSADGLTLKIPLLRSEHRTHSKAVEHMRRATGTYTSLDNSDGVNYMVPIKWNGQSFNAILDTGSSDTWIVSSTFQCQDSNGNNVSSGNCAFGPGFSGSLNTYRGEQFHLAYQDLEHVDGDYGTIPMSIGSVTVNSQTVALVNKAYWFGNGVASGLVGFAYPALTKATTASGQPDPYDPWWTSAYKQGSVPKAFGLVLMRGSSGGYLTLGNNPQPVGVGQYYYTPLQYLKAYNSQNYTFYTITPDAILYTGAPTKQTSQFIVDSGTFTTYIPTSDMKAVAAAYNPPASYDGNQGFYTVSCSATPPAFGFKIGGNAFYANATDMILQQYNTNGYCITGVQDSGNNGNLNILGATWLRSVVAVHDLGLNKLGVAIHKY